MNKDGKLDKFGEINDALIIFSDRSTQLFSTENRT